MAQNAHPHISIATCSTFSSGIKTLLTFVTYNKYYTLPCKSQPSKKIPEYIVILQDFVVNRIKAAAFAT